MRGLLRIPLLLLGLSVLAGCWRSARGDFPRPPATASTPEHEEVPETPAPVETRIDEQPVVDVEPEPEVVEPAPPPKEEPERAPPVSAPEPPDEAPAEPPSIELTGSQSLDPELLTKLGRANSLLSALGTRTLSEDQRQQFVAARAFVSQAQRALDEGDERRALVLIDKGLILAEDVERTSRP